MKTKIKNIFTTQNAKTSKGESLGYLTGILYLAPANLVKGLNLCKFATAGCKKSCLYTAGRGKFNNVQKARIAKTELFKNDLNLFFECLKYSIEKTIRQAKKLGLKPCIRLNGTSDIEWENILFNGKNIFEHFPDIQFYDYTKNPTRSAALLGHWKNYSVTFSRSESRMNHVQAENLLKLGVNVAAVYRDAQKVIDNEKIINGDLHDLRFLDKKNVIVALTAKGDAKKDKSGFVIQN